ncbi:hypothetical protein Ddc_17637 [Ditylenchus destructor]|nr:hypothetical protein Ddc_17637 [Ditylenchus destructor]
MPFLPNEIFADLTKFLPNDDITDLMLLSRKFNALVTPRLQKIDEEMATMNQSIKSPVPEISDDEWISQLNFKRFDPIGSKAKKRMQEAFMNEIELLDCLNEATLDNGMLKSHKESLKELLDYLHKATLDKGMLKSLKERMSLERFDDITFYRILAGLVSVPKFRQDYNISLEFSQLIRRHVNQAIALKHEWSVFKKNLNQLRGLLNM